MRDDHPNLVWMKENSLQESEELTDGSEVTAKQIVRKIEKVPGKEIQCISYPDKRMSFSIIIHFFSTNIFLIMMLYVTMVSFANKAIIIPIPIKVTFISIIIIATSISLINKITIICYD